VGSARSALVISALLCVSSPVLSSEVESPTSEPGPSGLLGHTIIRAYGAVVPRKWGPDLERAGWGTGFAISYGVARAVQIAFELAYHRFEMPEGYGLDVDGYSSATWDAVRQTTMSVELQSPRSWIRPSVGVGFGVYEMTETRNESYSSAHYRRVESGTRLGVHWGLGLSARLNQRLAIDLGGRHHHSFGRPFLASTEYLSDARILSIQAGLSYVVR
jgi:opacity protein-like surface antigen